MPWDEDERMSQIRIEPEKGEILKESDPLFLRKEKNRPKWFKLPEEMPGGLITLVILALVVLFILFIPNSKKAETEKKIASLEEKISRLAERVGHVEETGKGVISQETLDNANAQMKSRLDRVEASLSIVTKQMEERLTLLKTPAKKEEPSKGATDKKTIQPPQGKTAFHIVQPGDTLFSISRKYAMKPDELKQLNKLSEGQIYPGQKLQVRGK